MADAKQSALGAVDALEPVLKALSDDIWEHPECSLKEHYAAQRYCETLTQLGFRVERGLGGIDTAFSGSFGSGRPVIGILGCSPAGTVTAADIICLASARSPRPAPSSAIWRRPARRAP